MKRLLIVLLIVLFASAVYAGPLQDRYKTVARMRVVSASSCNPATDELGHRTQETNYASPSADVAFVQLYTPSCSGALDTAYVYRNDNDQAEVKVCVYEDNGDGVPGTGDTLVGACVTLDMGTSSGLKSSAPFSSGSVSTAKSYWLMTAISTTNPVTMVNDSDTSVTDWYQFNTSYYAAAPNELPANSNWTSTTSWGRFTIYVTLK